MKNLLITLVLLATNQAHAYTFIGDATKAEKDAWYSECKVQVIGMLNRSDGATFTDKGALMVFESGIGSFDSTLHAQNSYGGMMPINFKCSGFKGAIKAIRRYTIAELNALGR